MSRDDWPDIRAHITTEFNGEQPGGPLEEEIIEIYCTKPTAVLNAVPSISQSLRQGKINSGWAVLRTAAAKAALKPDGSTAVGREKLIRNADQWLKNAGVMYDRWPEVEDELFGERGRLRTIDTPTTRARYRQAWEDIRPQGERVEADELTRADKWKAEQEARDSVPKAPNPDEIAAKAAARGATT